MFFELLLNVYRSIFRELVSIWQDYLQ